MTLSKLLLTTAIILPLAVSSAVWAVETPATQPASAPVPAAPPPQAAHPMPMAGKPGVERMRQRREQMMSQLPPEKAKLFQETMKQAKDKNVPILAQIKKLRDEQKAIMSAEKFDQSAWLAKNAEIDKAYDQTRANRDNAMASVASQLTKEERMILAKGNRGSENAPPFPPPGQ